MSSPRPVARRRPEAVLGVGGTIAVLAAAGVRLRLIAVTDGESSHPGHRDPPGLARRRAQERAAALLALGAAAPCCRRRSSPISLATMRCCFR